MKLSAEGAIIAATKIRDYLLSATHPDGRGKAEYLARLGYSHPGGKAMTLKPFQRAVLTRDLPDQGLRAGDVGVIVEHYPAREDAPEGYELEFFTAAGQTIAVVSVPATAVREAGAHEVLSVREMARTS